MRLENKKVVIIGGSRGVGRAIAAMADAEGGKVLSVARQPESLNQLTDEHPGVATLAADATHENTPHQVFETLSPDVLVICGGAVPYMAPLPEQTWVGFSRNWESDVKSSFLFCQAALRLPLTPGSVIVLISSGAALGGSSVSGGYAGAKRMQMFLADYSQRESDRLGLGLRFLALAPSRIMPDTDTGKIAVAGYAEYLGISKEQFIQGMEDSPTPDAVAQAVVTLVTELPVAKTNVFTVSSKGIEPIA